jgi:hypothetical protein
MEFRQRNLEAAFLCVDKSLELEWVRRVTHMCRLEKVGPGSTVGGQPTRKNVEQDYDRAGHQQSGDQSKADQQDIDAGPVGKAGGDAHDLALRPVEDKTLVHFSILVFELLGDRQHAGGGADEQQCGDESGCESGGGFTARCENGEHSNFSLIRIPDRARASFNAGSMPNQKYRFFSMKDGAAGQ